MRPILPPALSLAMALILAGCTTTDPLTAPGLWRPIGANEANLVASVANPADLSHGRSDPVSDPNPILAVLRYRAGKPKPLPASGLAEIKLAPAGDTPGAAPADATPIDGSTGDGR